MVGVLCVEAIRRGMTTASLTGQPILGLLDNIIDLVFKPMRPTSGFFCKSLCAIRRLVRVFLLAPGSTLCALGKPARASHLAL